MRQLINEAHAYCQVHINMKPDSYNGYRINQNQFVKDRYFA